MAARIRLSSLALCLIAWFAVAPAEAQQSGFPVPDSTAAPSPFKAPVARKEDCSKLPGGNAPINKMARLEGGISVRNLDLTYNGKPLFEYGDEDFAYLHSLWRVCETYDAATAEKVVNRLKALVEDARAVRRDTIDWIKQTEKEAKALKPGHDGIEKIHDMWQQMLNREFDMLETDMTYIAGVLSKRRDELYAAPQSQQRTLISPFDPGPPEQRPLTGSGG